MNHLHVSVSEELWYLPSLKHTCIEKAHTHSLEVINFYTTSCIQKLNVHIVMLHTSYWMFRLSVFNIIIMTLWNLTWHFDWEKVTLEKMPASEGGSGHRRLEPIPAIKQWEMGCTLDRLSVCCSNGDHNKQSDCEVLSSYNTKYMVLNITLTPYYSTLYNVVLFILFHVLDFTSSI